MISDTSLLSVPQNEKEIAEFDWVNFPPNRIKGEKKCFSMIDECTFIHGKLITWSAFVHGQIDGLIFAEHVAVEKTGAVRGVIFCRTLSIFGRVNADIICDNVMVREGGMVSGVLKYRTMKIDPGGSASGQFERRRFETITAQGAAANFAAPRRAQPLFSI